MDESTKNYRKGELDGLESCAIGTDRYRVKVIGANGTETKWLAIDEEELAGIKGIMAGDMVNTALHMLANAGYIAKVYGPEDVHEVLDQYMYDNTSGEVVSFETLTYRDEITQHIIEGDGWEGILDADSSMDYIWGMIDGTHNDHPEWFPEVKEDKEPGSPQWSLTPILDEDDNDPVIEVRNNWNGNVSNVGNYAEAAEFMQQFGVGYDTVG